MSFKSKLAELKRNPLVMLEWLWGRFFIGLFFSPFWWLRSGFRWGFPVFIDSGVRICFVRKLKLGRFSSLGRYGYLNALSAAGVTLGRSVSIGERFWIQGTSHLSDMGVGLVIEDNVYIGPGAVLGFHGPVRIGSGSAIGANFQISAQSHDTSEFDKISTATTKSKGILIGRHCWIGNDVKVLDGVEIGDYVVVGAGAVVTKSIPAYSIAVGVPAVVIRNRIK